MKTRSRGDEFSFPSFRGLGSLVVHCEQDARSPSNEGQISLYRWLNSTKADVQLTGKALILQQLNNASKIQLTQSFLLDDYSKRNLR